MDFISMCVLFAGAALAFTGIIFRDRVMMELP
jgi:hypothetical protein